MRGSAEAHPVQGLVCPHGYSDPGLRLYPYEGVFVAMSSLYTRTSIEFSKGSGTNVVNIDGVEALPPVVERVQKFLLQFNKYFQGAWRFSMTSTNNFAAGTGLGSSSSAFAALTLAAAKALGLDCSDQRGLSVYARNGSSSAAGSLVGGVSVLRTGVRNEDGYAEPLVDPTEFPYSIIVMRSPAVKSTEEAHAEAAASPLFQAGAAAAQLVSRKLQAALSAKRWSEIGKFAEEYLYLSYAMIMTGPSKMLLWRPETVATFQLLRRLREASDLEFFYSMNTGANVYAYAMAGEPTNRLCAALRAEGREVEITSVGGGARIL